MGVEEEEWMLVKASRPIGNSNENRNASFPIYITIPLGHHYAWGRHRLAYTYPYIYLPLHTQIVGRVRGGGYQGQ
jgi:hypothetical protein